MPNTLAAVTVVGDLGRAGEGGLRSLSWSDTISVGISHIAAAAAILCNLLPISHLTGVLSPR